MAHPLSPTSVLPALVSLHFCDAARVGEALRALQDVYFPHAILSTTTMTGAVPVLKQSLSAAVPTFFFRRKRIACHVHHDGVPDSGYASAEEDDQDDEEDEDKGDEERKEELDRLRSDAFERGYAIKWLTGMVKRGDAWVDAASASATADAPTRSSEEQAAREARLEDASRFLSRFAGDDATGQALTRTFVFPFHAPPESSFSCRHCRCPSRSFQDDTPSTVPTAAPPPPPPIVLELNDAPVDETDHTAVGLQSWGSAIVFAERMCSDPERYLALALETYPCTCPCTIESENVGERRDTVVTTKAKTTARRRKLLELGAGTGLLSITAAQILSRTNARADIQATDYHSGVLENLARNVQHNRSVGVSVKKLDWCAVASSEIPGVDVDEDEGEGNDDGLGMYDVVLAADVVYYPEHAWWIRGCIERMMKKTGVFWLIIPVRTTGRHEGLGKTVEEAFPMADISAVGECMCNRELKRRGDGKQLAIVSREDVERVNGVGRVDEGGYTLFQICWV